MFVFPENIIAMNFINNRHSAYSAWIDMWDSFQKKPSSVPWDYICRIPPLHFYLLIVSISDAKSVRTGSMPEAPGANIHHKT